MHSFKFYDFVGSKIGPKMAKSCACTSPKGTPASMAWHTRFYCRKLILGIVVKKWHKFENRFHELFSQKLTFCFANLKKQTPNRGSNNHWIIRTRALLNVIFYGICWNEISFAFQTCSRRIWSSLIKLIFWIFCFISFGRFFTFGNKKNLPICVIRKCWNLCIN